MACLDAGLLYSRALSHICLTIKIAPMQDLPFAPLYVSNFFPSTSPVTQHCHTAAFGDFSLTGGCTLIRVGEQILCSQLSCLRRLPDNLKKTPSSQIVATDRSEAVFPSGVSDTFCSILSHDLTSPHDNLLWLTFPGPWICFELLWAS